MRRKNYRRAYIVLGLIVVVVAAVLCVGEKASAVLPPMPEEVMNLLLKGDPLWPHWADKLRGVYAALPESAKQQMLSAGWYSFRLCDLPKDQQEIMTDFALHSQNVAGFISRPNVAGSPPDLSKLTFAFGRMKTDEKYVRIRVGANGLWAQPEFACWPSQ